MKAAITIGGGKVMLQGGKDLAARVNLYEETILPAYIHVIAKTRLDFDIPKWQGVLLEPDLGKEELVLCLLVARTLFLTGEDILMRLNVNDYPMTLKAVRQEKAP